MKTTCENCNYWQVCTCGGLGMADKELLEKVETKVLYAMLDGCLIDDHLGNKKYDVGSWSVSLRADQLSRLIDIARSKK